MQSELSYLAAIATQFASKVDALAQENSPEEFLAYERNCYDFVKAAGDTPESYASYLRSVEAAALKSIYKTNKVRNWIELLTGNQSINSQIQAIKIFVAKYKYIVIYSGSSKMANGLLLTAALSSLDPLSKARVGIISIDEQDSCVDNSFSSTGVRHLSLQETPQISVRYLGLVSALLMLSPNELPSSICYWSLPLGLAFFYAVIRSFEQLDSIKLVHTSSKYSYCFSSLLVDVHIGGKNQEYYPRRDSHKKLDPFVYLASDLLPRRAAQGSREFAIRNTLLSLKESGKILVSSFARHEKTSTYEMKSLISRILGENNDLVFLRCGRVKISTREIDLAGSCHERIIDIGWNDLNTIIDLLDIYIDPVPEGGGYSLMLALANGVPCIFPPSISPRAGASPSPRYLIKDCAASTLDLSLFDIMFPKVGGIESSIAQLCYMPELALQVAQQCERLYGLLPINSVNYLDYLR